MKITTTVYCAREKESGHLDNELTGHDESAVKDVIFDCCLDIEDYDIVKCKLIVDE